jgi:hypothetical protein
MLAGLHGSAPIANHAASGQNGPETMTKMGTMWTLL